VTTKEDYTNLLEVLCAKFGFKDDKLHDLVTALIIPNPKTEIARVICHEKEDRIGIAFHVDLVPTDAIQIYQVAKDAYPKIELFHIYYQSIDGLTYTGIDAQMMLEQEREVRYFEAFAKRENAQQIEEAQIEQLEKKGKITFH
jgi:hypothetical protein